MADWLAIYGAAIGSSAAAGVVWNVYNSVLRDRARLKVRLCRELVGWAPHTVDCLGVEVSNVGRRPVTVQSYRFEAHDGRGLIPAVPAAQQYGPVAALLEQSLVTPKRLDEGQQHTFRWPLQLVREAVVANPTLRLVGAEVTDGTGRRWRCRLSERDVALLHNRGDAS
jgi:hypothetical protein